MRQGVRLLCLLVPPLSEWVSMSRPLKHSNGETVFRLQSVQGREAILCVLQGRGDATNTMQHLAPQCHVETEFPPSLSLCVCVSVCLHSSSCLLVRGKFLLLGRGEELQHPVDTALRQGLAIVQRWDGNLQQGLGGRQRNQGSWGV